MIRLTSLIETKFRNYKSHIHLLDVPMFSIFVDTKLSDFYIKKLHDDESTKYLKKLFADSKYQINKIGFPSMHANVIIKDLSKVSIGSTGDTGASGLASPGLKYMELDYLNGLRVSTVVHEWAHLWMMNNSKQFKNAVKKFYDYLRRNTTTSALNDEIPMNLSSSDKLNIINTWEYELPIEILRSLLYDHTYNIYTFRKNKVTPNLLKFVPQGTIVDGILLEELEVESMRGELKTLPVGSSVYAAKENSGWIIGYKDTTRIGDTRFETVISEFQDFDSLPEFVKSKNPKSDIYTDLTLAIKNRKSDYKTLKFTILSDLKDKVVGAFKKSVSTIKYYDPKLAIPTIEKWTAAYIFPRVIAILENEKLLRLYESSPHGFYNYIWLDANKPPEVSVVRLVNSTYSNSAVNAFKQHVKKNKSDDFNSPEFESLRQIMQKLNDWPNSYGMTNNLETWATAIEYFMNLPPHHKKIIIKLMMHSNFN